MFLLLDFNEVIYLNTAIKKYIALSLTLALSGTLGVGAVTASAENVSNVKVQSSQSVGTVTASAEKVSAAKAKSSQNVETDDTPKADEKKPTSSPFLNLKDVTKIPTLGDIDNDGKITSSDALTVLRASVGFNDNYTDRYYSGDVDGDSKLTSADALKILRKSVKLNDEFANEPLTGVKWFKDSENYYAQDSKGNPISGIVIIDGIRCGFDKDGKLLTGKSKVGNTEYDFLDNGVLSISLITVFSWRGGNIPITVSLTTRTE